jgi:hypothetical protein
MLPRAPLLKVFLKIWCEFVEGVIEAQMWFSVGSNENVNNPSDPMETWEIS